MERPRPNLDLLGMMFEEFVEEEKQKEIKLKSTRSNLLDAFCCAPKEDEREAPANLPLDTKRE